MRLLNRRTSRKSHRKAAHRFCRLFTAAAAVFLALTSQPTEAKSYQDYLRQFEQNKNTLQSLPRGRVPVATPNQDGAVFACDPFCRWISFINAADENILVDTDKPLSRIRFVPRSSPEFDRLFPGAPTKFEDSTQGRGRDDLASDKDRKSKNALEEASIWSFGFSGYLGVFEGATAVNSESTIGLDGGANPYLRFQLGASLRSEHPIPLWGGTWRQDLDGMYESSPTRPSNNSSGNSAALSLMRLNYTFLNTSSNDWHWGPFLGLWQSQRQYTNPSIQAISTQFQEVWFGGRLLAGRESSDWRLLAGTNIVTSATDKDGFRQAPQSFLRARIEIERCFHRLGIFGGSLAPCVSGLYEMTQEKTGISSAINPAGGSAKFSESSWAIGFKAYYGGGEDE